MENEIRELADEIRRSFRSDEPSPTQRADATWSLGRPDRLLGGFAITIPEALGIVDVSSREYYTSAHSFVYVHARAALEWSSELLVLRTDPYVEVEALGGRLNYPEHLQPWLAYPSLSCPTDLSRCRVPDPLSDGRMPIVIQTAALHNQYLGDVLPALVFCHSPFSLAVMLRGFHTLREDMVRDPAFAHELLRFCCETCKTYATAILRAGDARLGIIAPWEALLRRDSADVFDEFALQYLSRFVAAASASHASFGPVLWSRGSTQVSEWKRYLAVLRSSGVAALTAGEEEVFGWVHYRKTDMAELRETLASLGMVLVVHLSPTTVTGRSSDDLRQYVGGLFAPAARGGGMVVTTTIPARATGERIQGFSDAVRACRYVRPSDHG